MAGEDAGVSIGRRVAGKSACTRGAGERLDESSLSAGVGHHERTLIAQQCARRGEVADGGWLGGAGIEQSRCVVVWSCGFVVRLAHWGGVGAGLLFLFSDG